MYGLIIPTLPYALANRVQVDSSQLQFWNAAFLASWAGAVLVGSVLFGWFSGRGVSNKAAFVVGQVILAASTVLFMIAKYLPLLVLARVLQGLSGGVINTLGYSLTFATVGQDQIGVAIGYVTMSLSLGCSFGLIIGGPLYDVAGYIWVFIPTIVLIGIEIVMRVSLIEPASRAAGSALYERQSLLNSSTTGPGLGDVDHLVSQISARRSSFGDSTAAFTRITKGSPIRVLLGNRRFVVAMIALFIGNNFVGANDATRPVFAFDRLGFNLTRVALLMLTATPPQLLGSLAGWIVDRAGLQWPTASGFIVDGVALILMRFTEHESNARVAVLIALLVIYGCSITLFWGPIIAEVTFAVGDLEKRKPGVFGDHGALALGFGLQNAAFGAGAMVGPIYAGAILVGAGWGAMTLVLGVVSLVTAVPVVLYTGGDVLEPRRKTNTTASAVEES